MAFGDIRYYNDKEDKDKNRRITYLGVDNINPEVFASKYNIPLMEIEGVNDNKWFYYLGEPENDINFLRFVFSKGFGKVTIPINRGRSEYRFYYPSYEEEKFFYDKEFLKVPFLFALDKGISYRGIDTKITAEKLANMYGITFFTTRISSEICVLESCLDNLNDFFNELKKDFFKTLVLDDIFAELYMNDLSDKTVKLGLKLMKKMRGE